MYTLYFCQTLYMALMYIYSPWGIKCHGFISNYRKQTHHGTYFKRPVCCTNSIYQLMSIDENW